MGETTEVTATIETKSKETGLHHRRNKENKSTAGQPSSENTSSRSSITQWFTSFFTDRSSDQIDVSSDDEKHKKKKTKKHEEGSSKGSCFCRHICCKLFLFFCVTYLVMFLRPDYAILVRNSFESVLTKYNLTSPEFQLRPGQRLAAYRKPSMPIIIIPGIISTGLELWQGEKCAEGRFRHRFWTSMQMVDNIGRDHQCWLKHISLNLTTWYGQHFKCIRVT
jgi:hypothetical protein